jgi:hypothetical protein
VLGLRLVSNLLKRERFIYLLPLSEISIRNEVKDDSFSLSRNRESVSKISLR